MNVLILPAARADLLRQVSYYAEVGRPDVAARFLSAVETTLRRLGDMPDIGAPRHFPDESLAGLRAVPVADFQDIRVFYLPRNDLLTVVRILYGRRDVEAVFTDGES